MTMSKPHARTLVLLLLCIESVNASSTYGVPATSANGLVTVPSEEEKQNRIDYVRCILCDRLDYVLNDKRMSDFHAWVHEQGGEPKVFSMHGIDVNFEMDELTNMELDISIVPIANKVKPQDPFLPDRLNLSFGNSTRQMFHPSLKSSTDNQPPTALQLSIRAMMLSFHFAPVLSTAWLALCSSKFRCRVWYNWVAHCLAHSGAAFIKWGQWAATRSDMFPEALCDALSNLHNDAPAHPWEFTQAQVESSLDIPPGSLHQVFQQFDKQPIASGSIAQIHKAQLANGEIIAAKVRHPRVAQLIDMDFRLMALVASAVGWLPAFKSVKDSVYQFSHTMAAQSHLNVEAHHLEVLNYNFRNWESVGFPRPFYASSSVILETFEKGRIVTGLLDEFDEKAKGMDLKGCDIIPVQQAKFLVTTGVSLYLKMLLLDNLMHADLHPGNIMLHGFTDTHGNEKYQITLVDAGMVAQLTDEESATFIGMLTSIGDGDGEAAAEFALRFSLDNDLNENERERFKMGMVELFRANCRGYGQNTDVGEVFRGILGLIREHGIRIDANYATLVINVLCIEALGRRICPAYNVLDAARPLLQTYRRVVYQDDGYTPKSKNLYSKRVKKLMPVMLYGSKRRADNAFFKQIESTRRTRIAGGSVDPPM